MSEVNPVLMQCKVCGKDVASTAPACPHCGVEDPAEGKNETPLGMAPCNLCKKNIQKGIKKCPHCGAKDPTMTGKEVIAVGIILMVLVFGCMGLLWWDSGPSTTTPSNRSTSSSSSRSQEWYVGGTLHSASVGQWRTASYRDKLATSADWCAAADNSVSMGVLKMRAMDLVACIDVAVQDGNVDNQEVIQIAAVCATLLKDDG